MPFSGRWFYGDSLFIVDPWMWLALGLGVLLSRRSGSTGPARIALGIAFAYSAAMAGGAVAARGIARAEMEAIGGAAVRRILVSPVPLTPLQRSVVVEQDDGYRTAEFRWLGNPHVDPGSVQVHAKGPREHPAVRAAERTTLGRRFLLWARYPSFRVEESPTGGTVVHIVDLRYADRPGVQFGAVSIPVDSPAQLEVRE
jgi:inner membrane protein